MPTYDYRCNACAHAFEHFQSMSDPVKKKCPACGKQTLERLIGTGAAIIFKGDGFYQTDYRSEGYKKAADADKKSSEPAAASSESKNDSSKPDKDSKKGETSTTKAESGSDAKSASKSAARAEAVRSSITKAKTSQAKSAPAKTAPAKSSPAKAGAKPPAKTTKPKSK